MIFLGKIIIYIFYVTVHNIENPFTEINFINS